MKRYLGYIVLVDGIPTRMRAGDIRSTRDSTAATVFASKIDAVRAINQTEWIEPGRFKVIALRRRRVMVIGERATYCDE